MLFELIIALIIGLVAGIIVNVLADDLPLKRAPRLPRYVAERKKQAVFEPVFNAEGENITLEYVREDDPQRPVLAWSGLLAFLSGKRDSPDGTVRLNWRYPLTEILTIALMVMTVLAVHHLNSNPDTPSITWFQMAFWFVYMAIFSLIIVIDIEYKLILFVVVLPAMGLAIVEALVTSYPPDIGTALIGGAAGFIVFFLMYNGGFLFTYVVGALRGQPIKEVAFGYGDVMMATLSGLVLGWRVLIFAMFITVFLGAFGAILYLLVRAVGRGRYSAFTAIPYGPYIVAGTIIMLLFRDPIGPILFGAVFP